ncbi:YoaK family protein [Mycobacterium sp. ITM-2016-00316]|uniref:YoaK family protein n=1 Tax=Mycobacterium sp. ITM-2016-00316 TaxID=2099695 RepID=UPI001E4E37CD|nr:YoaK family protein [Mycobacterium sp. ITM-2016-00316]WNG82075.1 YoaK family protein [Mycobacterium sp. ITM-2016-00316]
MIRHLHVWLMMALTVVTGALDAVGYLGLDRVFTGNMTGNVVILGMGVAAEEGLPVAGPLIALVGYVAGAAIVGGMIRGRARAWTSAVTATMCINAVVLAGVATALLFVPVSGRSSGGVAAAATIALVMGAQASIARFLAVTDLTTVVVTSTITSYASETLYKGGLIWFTHRRLWAVVAIFAGALAGGLLMKMHISVPVYAAAAVTLACAVLAHHFWERAEAVGAQ